MTCLRPVSILQFANPHIARERKKGEGIGILGSFWSKFGALRVHFGIILGEFESILGGWMNTVKNKPDRKLYCISS